MEIIQKSISKNNYSTKTSHKTGFVLHWIVGELSSADATFANPNRMASAHYGIGSNGEIHQYVPDNQIAWHAGNSQANRDYIGIEHAGGQMIGNTRKVPTNTCHESSITLITSLCRKLGIKKLVRGQNIFKHNEVSLAPTECSGSLRIDFITQRVNENLQPQPEIIPEIKPPEINYQNIMYDQTINKLHEKFPMLKAQGYFNNEQEGYVRAVLYKEGIEQFFNLMLGTAESISTRLSTSNIGLEDKIKTLESKDRLFKDTEIENLLLKNKVMETEDKIKTLESNIVTLNSAPSENSSNKPWFKSKKFLAVAAGVITMLTSTYFPDLQEVSNEIIGLLGVYIVGQTGIDVTETLSNNKK